MNNPMIPNTSALINWTNFLMMPYEIEVLTKTSFIDEQIVTLLESDIPFIHNVDGNQLLVPYNKSTLKQQSKLTPDFLEKPITSQKQLLDYLEEMIGGGFCFMCSIKGGMKSNFTSDNCCNDTIIRGPLFQDTKFIRHPEDREIFVSDVWKNQDEIREEYRLEKEEYGAASMEVFCGEHIRAVC